MTAFLGSLGQYVLTVMWRLGQLDKKRFLLGQLIKPCKEGIALLSREWHQFLASPDRYQREHFPEDERDYWIEVCTQPEFVEQMFVHIAKYYNSRDEGMCKLLNIIDSHLAKEMK